MIKKIYLILAVAGIGCSLQMKAAVPPVTKDTVHWSRTLISNRCSGLWSRLTIRVYS